MSRTPGLLLSLSALSALMLASCGAPGTPAPETPAPSPPTAAAPPPAEETDAPHARDGVYTTAQADRGEAEYEAQCVICHGPREFSGPAFLRRWASLPVGSLFRHIQTTMPDTAPGSLTSQQAADLVAYVLRLNGFPTGTEELPPEAEVLSLIRMDQPTGF